MFRLGHALRRQGLEPGDGVGLFLANRVDSVLVQLAVHLIGCRVVFLPPEPGPGELAALVEQSRARAVVTDPLFAERAADAAGRSVHAPVLLSLGPCEQRCADLLALEAECPAERPDGVPAPGADEAVTVLYTGGTLGRPKLAAHSHRLYDALVGLVEGALQGSRPTPFPAMDPGTDRVLASTLLTHGSGHLTTIQALVTGSTLVVLPEFEAGAALAVLREERITATMFVPPMLYALLDHPECVPGLSPHCGGSSSEARPRRPAGCSRRSRSSGPYSARVTGSPRRWGSQRSARKRSHRREPSGPSSGAAAVARFPTPRSRSVMRAARWRSPSGRSARCVSGARR